MSKPRPYTRHEPLLKKLSKLSSFTLSEAIKIGLSHPVLLRLVKDGKVIRLQRGLYAVSGKEPIGEVGDYLTANKKFEGKGVIGGLTALSHYHLIEEIPTKLWILVPQTVRTTDKRYRLLRTNKDLNIGVLRKEGYRIVTLERALVDALWFSSKIGERVAVTAILKALRQKQTTPQKLFEVAKKMNAIKMLNKQWQPILAGLTH